MILPLIGYVGKQRYSVSGLSNTKGFELRIYDSETEKHYSFYAKNYLNDDFDSRKHPILNCICTLIYLLVGILIITISINSVDLSVMSLKLFLYCSVFPILIASLAHYITLIIIGTLSLSVETDLKEWHALEHKCVALIEAGIQPTVENIKTCPTTNLYCRIAERFIFVELIIAMAILPYIFYYVLPLNNLTDIFIFYIPTGTICFYIIHKASLQMFNYWKIPLFLIALPLTAIPLLAEKVLTLKEPSEDKIIQTVVRLQIFTILFKINRP